MAQVSWIGQTLNGRYKIDELLGQGGMSAVYKATDPNLRRVVAIKMIHPHLSNNPEFVRRFEDEAAAVAQMRHPNIVQVFDFNHDGDVYYMVLEFLPGETLQERLVRLNQKGRQMGLGEAVNFVAQVADALQYAHERGIIHRDIKPANIMLDIYGKANLMDFGIARIVGGQMHTATGAVVGTALYMSPEQIVGQRVDERADIYSLGVTLFESISGRPPFEADSAMTLMMMHMNDPVPDLHELRPQVPEALIAVVERALQKKVDQRFQKASDMATELRSVLALLPPDAMQSGVRQRPVEVENTVVEVPEVPPAPVRTEVEPSRKSEATQVDTGDRNTPAVRSEPEQTQIDNATAVESPAPVRDQTPVYSKPQTDEVRTQVDLPSSKPEAQSSVSTPLEDAPSAVNDVSVNMSPTKSAAAPVRKTVFGIPALLAGILGFVALAVMIGLVFVGGRLLLGGGGSTSTPTAETALVEGSEAQVAALLPTDTSTPTVAPSNTSYVVPTRTPTSAPTSTPTYAWTATPTVPTDRPYVRINNITIADGRYVVEYETFGYTEQLPGMHVHFFYDTVKPEQAGLPGSGPWILYGGPRPFTKYLVAEKPANAKQMCALVANANHSIQLESGNCFPLPPY